MSDPPQGGVGNSLRAFEPLNFELALGDRIFPRLPGVGALRVRHATNGAVKRVVRSLDLKDPMATLDKERLQAVPSLEALLVLHASRHHF